MAALTPQFQIKQSRTRRMGESHHHQVAQLAQISLTFSCQASLSSIAPGRSSSLYPVSIQSCCRYVLLGHPTLVCPCEGIHRRTSLMILFLLRQQCPACFVCLTWMVLEIGGRWPYNSCFIGYCFQDLFHIAPNILVQLFLNTLCQRPCGASIQ